MGAAVPAADGDDEFDGCHHRPRYDDDDETRRDQTWRLKGKCVIIIARPRDKCGWISRVPKIIIIDTESRARQGTDQKANKEVKEEEAVDIGK